MCASRVIADQRGDPVAENVGWPPGTDVSRETAGWPARCAESRPADDRARPGAPRCCEPCSWRRDRAAGAARDVRGHPGRPDVRAYRIDLPVWPNRPGGAALRCARRIRRGAGPRGASSLVQEIKLLLQAATLRTGHHTQRDRITCASETAGALDRAAGER